MEKVSRVWFGGRPVAPTDCLWPWASPVNSKPVASPGSYTVP